jgi:hypothetical protein
MRAATHPIDCIAEFEIAIASAHKARAFIKSSGTLNPPVITSVISFDHTLSKYLLALARAGIVGTDILFLKISGAAQVHPHLPSRII